MLGLFMRLPVSPLRRSGTSCTWWVEARKFAFD